MTKKCVEDVRRIVLLRSYFREDTVCVDSSLCVKYMRLVKSHILMFGNMVSYFSHEWMSLLWVTYNVFGSNDGNSIVDGLDSIKDSLVNS